MVTVIQRHHVSGLIVTVLISLWVSFSMGFLYYREHVDNNHIFFMRHQDPLQLHRWGNRERVKSRIMLRWFQTYSDITVWVRNTSSSLTSFVCKAKKFHCFQTPKILIVSMITSKTQIIFCIYDNFKNSKHFIVSMIASKTQNISLYLW